MNRLLFILIAFFILLTACEKSEIGALDPDNEKQPEIFHATIRLLTAHAWYPVDPEYEEEWIRFKWNDSDPEKAYGSFRCTYTKWPIPIGESRIAQGDGTWELNDQEKCNLLTIQWPSYAIGILKNYQKNCSVILLEEDRLVLKKINRGLQVMDKIVEYYPFKTGLSTPVAYNPNAFPANFEICDNGIDDDCDGRIDCEDEDCVYMPDCLNTNPGNLLETTVNDGVKTYKLYAYPGKNHATIPWGPRKDVEGIDLKPPKTATSDFDGAANTRAIVDQLQNNNGLNYAARVCADLIYRGYDDWYLPALGELLSIFEQLDSTAQEEYQGHYYWSSTEYDLMSAWVASNTPWAGAVPPFIKGQISPKAYKNACLCVRKSF